METPSELPLPLMALFKAMVLMPNEHIILILVEDATLGCELNTYCVKGGYFLVFKDGTDLCYMHCCLYEVSFIYIHNIILVEGNDNMHVEFNF